MNNENLKPSEGESLVNWINRTRPKTAPAVSGSPEFWSGRFAWRLEGWTIDVDVIDGGTTVHWEAPEGNVCIGYSLNDDGERQAAVDVDGGDWVDEWPEVAA